MHRTGQIEVALLAASASENDRSRRFPGNATIFLERVSALGWQDLPLVPMPGIVGLSYWDHCYYVEDREQFQRDLQALWTAIAPKVARDPSDHLPHGQVLTDEAIQSAVLSKWRNTWCDVISAYSHIKASRDIFVTNNTSDFQRNAAKLSELGMNCIANPTDVFDSINRIGASG